MTFKEKLVRLRKIKGLTQDEFANAVGVSRQAVYKWESGQSYPEVAKLLEIKVLFEISIDDLLDDNYEVALPEKKKRKRAAKEVRVADEAAVLEVSVSESDGTEVIEAVNEERIPEVAKEEAMVAASAEQSADLEAPKAQENASDAMISIKYESKLESVQTDDESKKRVGFFGRIFGRK